MDGLLAARQAGGQGEGEEEALGCSRRAAALAARGFDGLENSCGADWGEASFDGGV